MPNLYRSRRGGKLNMTDNRRIIPTIPETMLTIIEPPIAIGFKNQLTIFMYNAFVGQV